eukprot:TRINITY_DN3004_c0_g1_i1.p1 TRINITY_DN3004_c0_g1~~TRINITY_DN3004_c0_g1_i1.p1  ORF type:complete len:339 (+),score=46.13 TRINITY_DN3004_c0_g1_i1:62-1078(+)
MNFHPRMLLRKEAIMLVTILTILIWFWKDVPEEELVFISIGDWGGGGGGQREVANALEKIASREPNLSFILSLGDNFYDAGVQDINDEKFKTHFEHIYGAADKPYLKTLPWYLILGDHDHRGSIDAQVQYSKKNPVWHLSSPYYSMHKGENPTISFIMIDSVGLEAGVMSDGDTRRFPQDLDPLYTSKEAAVKQMKWIEDQMKTAPYTGADWVIVVGHRPILTAGVRPRTSAENKTAEYLQSVLRKAPVQLFLNGHDHTAQHLKDPVAAGLNYIVTGGGGYANGLHKTTATKDTIYADTFMGFCLHRVSRSRFVTEFVDSQGVVRQRTVIYNNKSDEK